MRVLLVALFGLLTVTSAGSAFAANYPPGIVAYYDEAAQEFVDDRNEQLARYRATPLEHFVGKETAIFRAFYRHSYLGFSPLVQFERAPGGEPRVIVMLIDAAKPIMDLPISGVTWNRIVKASAFFEREFVTPPPPPPPTGDEEEFIVICTDGLTMLVEAIDREGTIRRKAQHSCMDDLSLAFGDTLAREAVAALPACSEIDERFARGYFSMLSTCSTFEGDRSAAAQVVNLMNEVWLYSIGDREEDVRLRRLFASDAVVKIEGFPETNRGAANVWSVQLPDGSMYFDRTIGRSATQVTVLGTIEFNADDSDGGKKMVPVRLEWQDDGYGDFEIKLIQAGAVIGEPGSGLPADRG